MLRSLWLLCGLALGASTSVGAAETPVPTVRADIVVVGATPGGIMAAIAAARCGHPVVLLERTHHVGGLPANGLGATDIRTRGATAGLFLEFTQRIRRYYAANAGPASAAFADCSDGYHFEPHVAEQVFYDMLAREQTINVLVGRQFDVVDGAVEKDGAQVTAITVTNRASGAKERYAARVFIDATYEGDLAAAAGAPFTTRRESAKDHGEPRAGRVYIAWGAGQPSPGSTGEGDDTIQAYNYRLCLTQNPEKRVPFAKPATYRREEYASLVDDVKTGHFAGVGKAPVGFSWLTNMVKLPDGKVDANNQHLAFISTDLPEENYRWPTADWAWRDQFAQRLRDYTLGLFWFAQHDEALPADFRAACADWGLAKDEYADNQNFPRQVYVREGRRILGEHFFTAKDALPTKPGGRPPIYADSVTASHYNLDSHAHHKREAGRVGLDGFFSYDTAPYTVPYGVMLPRGLDNLLTPVPVSATHVGYSTLRMEPCWMALGQAAGVAAATAIQAAPAVGSAVSVRRVDRAELQSTLLDQGAVLMYFRDAKPGDHGFTALQWLALRGGCPEWNARLGAPVESQDVARWAKIAGVAVPPDIQPGTTTRADAMREIVAATRRPGTQPASKTGAKLL